MNSLKYVSKHGSVATLTIALCTLAVTVAVQAQQDSQEQALRELNIMRNIFDAALEADNRQNRMRMGPPEAMYLAGQGMVFTFHLDGMAGFDFGKLGNLGNLRAEMEQQAAQLRTQAEQLRQQTAPVVPPEPPAASIDGDYSFDFDFDYDYDFDFDFGEGDNEQQSAYRDQMREMNEMMRAEQEEMRDMQRKIRDLAREERNDPDADNAVEMERLNAQMDALAETIQSLSESMQQQQQAFNAERVAAFETLRTQQTDMIFTTLCDYGNTLRSLASGEHVNIVLRNYADNQSQVHVFDYADIANCASAADLRMAAISYIQDNRGF